MRHFALIGGHTCAPGDPLIAPIPSLVDKLIGLPEYPSGDLVVLTVGQLT